MVVYHLSTDSSIKNYQSYVPGSFYKLYGIDNSKLVISDFYGEQTRSVDDEEEYRFSLIRGIDNTQTLIMHNHVSPFREDIRNYLINNSVRNVFIYRKDKRAQLGSYAIAYSTKEFISFGKKENNSVVDDINPIPLYNLIDRIKVWDSLPKDEVIAYEDIPFKDISGFPVRQVDDYRKRLSDRMLKIIDDIVTEYEKSKS